jgi:hypothetical protein
MPWRSCCKRWGGHGRCALGPPLHWRTPLPHVGWGSCRYQQGVVGWVEGRAGVGFARPLVSAHSPPALFLGTGRLTNGGGH